MIGQTISHYRILEKLGAGGMGVVYKAEDLKLKRTVALKFLPPELTRDSDAEARFVHEAQAAAALNHPNIATIHEINESDGHTFIVMEYVEGQSLKDRLESGPLATQEALRIATKVTAGLEYAHRRGVVHRDIKPGNILFAEDGTAKIADFGLAKLSEQTRLTKTGTMVGTVAYMSPEQAQGDAVDQRADLWSLGVMLYEMVTGRVPFRGEAEPAVVYSILNEDPDPVTSLSEEASVQLENLLDKALAKDPDKRFQSAAELRSDLASQLELLESGLASRRFLALRRFRRNRRAFYGTLAGLGVVLAATVTLVFHGRSVAIDSIAVLPFESLTEKADQEYIADGMTRELTATLGQVSGWDKVISHRTMRKYKETDKSPRDIASDVRVKAVLSGSVQRLASDQIQTIVELVDGESERLLWTQTFECALREFKDLQGEITRTIIELVDIELTATEEARLARVMPVNPVAYENYVKGLHHYEKWTKEGFEKAIEYFEKAIEADPNHARAYDGLADCYGFLGFQDYLSLEEARFKMNKFARKALEIDDKLAEAHETLAGEKHYYDWDWAGAETGYRHAIELDPSFVEAHLELAILLAGLGRSAEAIAEAKRAQQLDPLSLPANRALGNVLYQARQHDQAIAQWQQVAELMPNDPVVPYSLASNYEQMGRYEDAVRARQETMRLMGYTPEKIAALDSAYSEAGRQGYWMWHLERWKGGYDRNPVKAAKHYTQLGDKDKAFAWLEMAYEDHDPRLVLLKSTPYWDPLRDDPRYHDLLRRMNLAEE